MLLTFATCDRTRALGFLCKLRNREVLDTDEDAKAVLDLVEADVVRIPDPDMHPAGGVVPGDKWDDSWQRAVHETFSKFMAVKQEGKNNDQV